MGPDQKINEPGIGKWVYPSRVDMGGIALQEWVTSRRVGRKFLGGNY